MANEDIKNYAKKNRVMLWEVAENLGFSHNYFSAKLRREWSYEEKQRFIDSVDKIRGAAGKES